MSFYFSGINWLYLAITAVHLITQFFKVACQVKYQSVEVAKYHQCLLSIHNIRFPPLIHVAISFYCKTCKQIFLQPDTLTSTGGFSFLCVNQLSFLNASCSGILFSSLIAQPLGFFLKIGNKRTEYILLVITKWEALYSTLDLDHMN